MDSLFFSSFSIGEQNTFGSLISIAAEVLLLPSAQQQAVLLLSRKQEVQTLFAISTKYPFQNYYEPFLRDDRSGKNELSTPFAFFSPPLTSRIITSRLAGWFSAQKRTGTRRLASAITNRLSCSDLIELRAITSRLACWFCNENRTGTRRLATAIATRFSRSYRRERRGITSRFASSYRSEPPTLKNRPPNALLLPWHPAALSPWFSTASPSVRHTESIRKHGLGVYKSSIQPSSIGKISSCQSRHIEVRNDHSLFFLPPPFFLSTLQCFCFCFYLFSKKKIP